MFILQGGFLMGIRGFVISGASALYVFFKYAKLWELRRGTEYAGAAAAEE